MESQRVESQTDEEESQKMETLLRLSGRTWSEEETESSILADIETLRRRPHGNIMRQRMEILMAESRLRDFKERERLIESGACPTCLGAARLDWRGDPCLECEPGRERAARIEAARKREDQQLVDLLIQRSNIPDRFADYTFASFPAVRETAAVVKSLRAWDGEISDGQGIFISGDYGRGKTGLACATLRQFIERSLLQGHFIQFASWLEGLKAEFNGRSSPGPTIETCINTGLLVIDDLGAERVTEWTAERLFLLVNERHSALRPTVVTSNLTLVELTERLGERIVSRIYEATDQVLLKGPNLRLRR